MAPMAIQSPTLGTASWDPLTKENIPLIVERVTGSTNRKKSKHDGLEELYSENIFAKLVRVAVRDLEGNVSFSS